VGYKNYENIQTHMHAAPVELFDEAFQDIRIQLTDAHMRFKTTTAFKDYSKADQAEYM